METTPYKHLRSLYSKPEDWKPQWADHLKVFKSGRTVVYVSEPYQLYPEAFEDFHTLEANGWHVRVDGQSQHYPGHTLRVRISAQPLKRDIHPEAAQLAGLFDDDDYCTGCGGAMPCAKDRAGCIEYRESLALS